ncbi:Superoxide dismutase [Vitis vinifera]|uniref:superoxide dismutase n=1 Tax=Vitis vinifera TaxID=29760 RepID=A0A438KCE4_VITVI|nr:Superoxide dismutase [Vitis vinifera]
MSRFLPLLFTSINCSVFTHYPVYHSLLSLSKKGCSEKMVKAVAVLNSNEGACGTIYFAEEGDGSTTVTGSLSGLKPGLHGFHVHALGDTTNGCMSTGIITYLFIIYRTSFNPAGKEHGAPEDENRHAGDLGNVMLVRMSLRCFHLIVCFSGTVNFKIVDKQIPLTGSNSIVGRAVVVHADPDDLGKGKL